MPHNLILDLNYLKNKYNWIIRIDADEYFEDLKFFQIYQYTE